MSYTTFLFAAVVFLGLWFLKCIIGWTLQHFEDDIRVHIYKVQNQDLPAYRDGIQVKDNNPAALPSRIFFQAAWMDFGIAFMCGILGLLGYLA